MANPPSGFGAGQAEDDMREMRRADALHEAVKSFGHLGAPDADAVLERADKFDEWLRRRDEAATVSALNNTPRLRPVS